MHNFCTLFDSYYLSRGIAMYRSLKKNCPDFHLYIFPFDAKALEILTQLSLDHVTLISLEEFENEDLLGVKKSRTKGEYCWTCTSSTIYYCLTKFDLPICTYIDADLFFYSDPDVLIKELGESSVLITEHRYTKEYDQSKTNGIYCVQFISFKNDESGMKALTWWRDRCIEWCFNRLEDGKFGDQKYLDDWTTRFEGVHVLRHLGGGVAPWNVQQYRIEQDNFKNWITNKNEVTQELVFFHFHWVRFLKNNKVDLGCYKLNFPRVDEIYEDYLNSVVSVDHELYRKFDFRPMEMQESFLSKGRRLLADMKRRIEGTYFVVDLKPQ